MLIWKKQQSIQIKKKEKKLCRVITNFAKKLQSYRVNKKTKIINSKQLLKLSKNWIFF